MRFSRVARGGLVRRSHVLVGVVLASYAVAMAVAWTATSSLAYQKTLDLLRESRATFNQIAGDEIDCVLWYASRLLFDDLGDAPRPMPAEEVRRLAARYRLDELNVVDGRGVIVASNFESQLGHRFSDSPVLAGYLRLLEPGGTTEYFGQPCRRSVTNAGQSFKYYGVAYPNRSGFVQLGFSVRHVVQVLEHVSASAYSRWRIGRGGHFEAVDWDGCGCADDARAAGVGEDGVMGEGSDALLGRVFTYDYPFEGLLFRSVVPASEFHGMRNQMMAVVGLSLAGILTLLTFFLLKLSRSSEKIEAMHRAAEARRAADLALAHVIQKSSLPHTGLFRPAHLDSTFDAATYPAREVGGDFYGLFERPDGRIVFLVADVAGKGIPAAMFMLVATNAIYTGFQIFDDIAETVSAINNYLCDHNDAEMFVTAWIGVLDPGSGEVAYVNAGHNRPYVLRRDGRVERLDGKGGPILGLFPQKVYRTNRVRLAPGDRMFLYTDGVTEAMDGARRIYGAARLERVLARAPADLCAAVKADVDAHVAGEVPSDDLTVASLAWHGTPPRTERTFPASADALGGAVAFLRESAALGNARQKARLLNAADEMMANVVGYSGGRTLSVAVENVPGRCRVTLSDDGEAYNPLTHADPDTHAPLQDRQVGGLGILMAKRLVSSVSYRRAGGRNVLALVQGDFEERYHNRA